MLSDENAMTEKDITFLDWIFEGFRDRQVGGFSGNMIKNSLCTRILYCFKKKTKLFVP